MILSNAELFKALDDGRIIIRPEPEPRQPSLSQPHCPYDTHSVDLRLAPEISVPEDGQFAYDLKKPGAIAKTISDNCRTHVISDERPFRLKPNKFVLARTIESVELPIKPDSETCLAARIEGKSSCARFGILVHFTAPTVHPGWNGTLTLEMINLGPADFLLTPNMFIAQLIVEEVKGCPVKNPSQFQGQSNPAGIVDGNGRDS